MFSPKTCDVEAAFDQRYIKYFALQELLYERMLEKLDRGRSRCTKLMEERGIDLDNLFDDARALPSGIPLELKDWLTCYVAADLVGARLERMRQLLQSQEGTSAQKASSAPGGYPTLGHSCSNRTEGKLQYPVSRQSPTFDEAVIGVENPKSLASQSFSQCQTSSAAMEGSLPAYLEQETAPLIPKPKPITAVHAASKLRHRSKTPALWTDEEC